MVFYAHMLLEASTYIADMQSPVWANIFRAFADVIFMANLFVTFAVDDRRLSFFSVALRA